MKKEIERKFLVAGDTWKKDATGVLYRQGYLHHDNLKAIRVRIAGDKGYLTIKKRLSDEERDEFEYSIHPEEAEMLLNICEPYLIEKLRYTVPASHGLVWEIDEFLGENHGLILAEIELEDKNQSVSLPDFISKEVTSDPKYLNSSLSKMPFRKWRER